MYRLSCSTHLWPRILICVLVSKYCRLQSVASWLSLTFQFVTFPSHFMHTHNYFSNPNWQIHPKETTQVYRLYCWQNFIIVVIVVANYIVFILLSSWPQFCYLILPVSTVHNGTEETQSDRAGSDTRKWPNTQDYAIGVAKTQIFALQFSNQNNPNKTRRARRFN